MAKIIPDLTEYFTLKKRIVLVFALSTLIPIICTVVFAYHTMSSILTSKLNASLQDNLKQVELSLENTIVNLNHVSQQLAFPGSVGIKLDAYLHAVDPYERAHLYSEFKNEFNVLTFSNPSIGLTMYYVPDENRFLFNNYGVKENFSIENLPLLADNYKIKNLGPHVSLQRYNDQYVLSTLRQVDIPLREPIYVYIESAFNLTQDILQTNQTGKHSNYLILDHNGNITYSDEELVFPTQTAFEEGDSGIINGFYWFKRTSSQGWSIISLIPKAQYNEEKNQWLVQMIYLTLFFVVLSLIVAWLLWLMVYRPLHHFNQEIHLMTNNDFGTRIVTTKIPEFDALLRQFQHMKSQILSLFKEVELKEKRRADLEVEKLLYQINPHFLMNTLDTAHWLAVLNGQKEIDQIVTSLNKLLSYNLGKLGELSTIREEIESMKQYLTLQQVRYDFEFSVNIAVENDLLDTPVPRFILQPLVENSLYHGLSDDGHITVTVKGGKDNQIEIAVKDNGSGMSAEKIEQLLNNHSANQQKAGLGIGMNYVKRVIERQYDGKATLSISSDVGRGTIIFLTIPIKEVHVDDKSNGRG
ncbi:sensor histidine kinase [Bacillus solitudinis]|uniref:sensor histidine kinase n=1 Tax=Bacillus solitudinis TaxID=2014074 RepID=UPI000C230E84|nr:sensor histidine kinase [Bacillus solitudinis]